MNKKNVALVINLLIVIFEIVGFVITIKENGRLGIEYYTEDSNILCLIISFIYIFNIIFNKKISKYLKMFKYISTVCLTVTFLVVILILAPMYNFNDGFLLFHNEFLYHHLLCPLLCIISFIFFDGVSNYSIKDSIVASIATLLYGVVLIVLNIVRVVDGPYPFLRIYSQPLYMSIVWIVVILCISYFIALILRYFNNLVNKGKKV